MPLARDPDLVAISMMKSHARSIDVTLEHVQQFARATCEVDPIYNDLAIARQAGYSSIPAPPTFGHALMLCALPEQDLFAEAGIDLRRALHAEQAFTYLQPILVGERITLTTVMSERVQKKGGALVLFKFETKATNSKGELCLMMQSTVAVKHG
jgi:acyl dehydratase